MKINSAFEILREEAFDIKKPEVSVSTVSSEVQIIESPDGRCHVAILGKSGDVKNLDDLVEIEAHDTKISVRVDKRSHGFLGLFSGGSADLSVLIKLPSASTIKVATVSADVEINQGVRSVIVGTVSGDINVLHNPTGACNLKTVSGDISTRTFSSCQYSLKSVSGDIKVLVAPGLEVDVDGKSVSGDLESEISLNSNNDATLNHAELVTIRTSTVSGDFSLARN